MTQFQGGAVTEWGKVAFDDLPRADLVLDRVYEGGVAKNAGDDPIGKLVPVGNQGGFRFAGSVRRGGVKLMVLYTSGGEVDWPDHLDPTTGDFTYYGDNRRPGRELHDTPRGGNLLLRSMFEDAHDSAESRRRVPPILLFEKTGHGRDVRFRGLLVPGSSRLRSDEELVAIWRTTLNQRFQNYRAHFTVLRTHKVTRRWIDSVLDGDPLGPGCPREWKAWVRSRIYLALEAPRTVQIRSRAEQLPDERDLWILEQVHEHFASDPTQFEHLAAHIWLRLEPRVTALEVTRPSRDGGRDAIGELLVGPEGDPIHLEFALEAKCYKPGSGIGVRLVSRLISRIKHREFGVFVTTSYVAEQAYREVREDRHPVVFVTGRDVVEVLKTLGFHERARLQKFLEEEYPVEAGVASVELVRPEIDIKDARGVEHDGLMTGEGSHPESLDPATVDADSCCHKDNTFDVQKM